MPENLTLVQMRSLVRKGLGNQTVTELPDTDVDLLLNLAFKELNAKWPYKEKECAVEATATIGTFEYETPGDVDYIRSVRVLDTTATGNNEPQKLRQVSLDEWDIEAGADESDERAIPEIWMRWNNILRIWPSPDKAYLIRISMMRNLPLLLSGTVDATGIPAEWDEILVKMAIAKGHFFNEDYELEQQAGNSVVGAIRNATLVRTKEEEDMRYAGVEVLHDRPESRKLL
jgi:hypothetical protein